jgi:hypothetical protein
VPGHLSQRNHAADRDAVDVDGWHELSVANPMFLLERLGSECIDLQGLRELTVNGLDAIAALGDRAGGLVVWDLGWLRVDASGGTVRKLSVGDTGTGMPPEQLRQYISQLASSGRDQSGPLTSVSSGLRGAAPTTMVELVESWIRDLIPSDQ